MGVTSPPEPTGPTGSAASGGRATIALADLRGLRTSPILQEPQRLALRQELMDALRPYPWFTIGVMAPNAAAAVACLRQWETALGWTPLAAAEPDPAAPSPTGSELESTPEGPVFLKGNQRNGSFLLRREDGLGEGVLISGQNPENAGAGDTWGPLPLDLFEALAPESGSTQPGSAAAGAEPAATGP